MAAQPASTISLQDPGFQISAAASLIPLILGVASGGVAGLTYHTTPSDVVSTYVDGPAVDDSCFVLKNGGGPIGVLKGTPSVAADNSAITKVDTHAGPTITVAGSALNDFFVRIKVTLGGGLGVGKIQYSLDGFAGDTDDQRTWNGGDILIPSGGTYAIPNTGLTVTFPDEAYLIDTEYTFVAECAALAAADVSTAFEVLQSSKRRWRYIHAAFSANNGNAAAHATLAATFEAELNLLTTFGKYRRGIQPAESAQSTSSASAVSAAFTSVAAPRLNVVYGQGQRVAGKPLIGFARPRRNLASVVTAIAAGSALSTDLKRVLSGPAPGLLELFDDEFLNPTGLDDINITTFRTWPSDEQTGFFINQARLKGGPSSNFNLWPRGLVMDVGCEIVHEEQIKFVGRGFRTNIIGDAIGALDVRDILRLEKDVNERLEAALTRPKNAEGNPGHVTALQYKINREWNVAQTETIVGDFVLVGLSYPSQVLATVGYALTLE